MSSLDQASRLEQGTLPVAAQKIYLRMSPLYKLALIALAGQASAFTPLVRKASIAKTQHALAIQKDGQSSDMVEGLRLLSGAALLGFSLLVNAGPAFADGKQLPWLTEMLKLFILT